MRVYLFGLVIDSLTKNIQDGVWSCMLFVAGIVLIDEVIFVLIDEVIFVLTMNYNCGEKC